MMDWETFTTKLIPWTLIIVGVTFVVSLISGFVYLWYHNHKNRISK